MRIDKVELSGLIVLFAGVILLAFTFFSAYTFLIGNLSILASQNLLQVFGEAMAPLIEAVIRILYLGIMGWISSILTIRAVQLLKKEKPEIQPMQQKPVKAETKQAAKPEVKPEVKEEAKPEVEKPKEVKEEAEKAEAPKAPEAPEKVEKSEEPVAGPPVSAAPAA